jgi:small multidrug resistance pump
MNAPLKPWMWFLLRFAGTFNLLAGFSMIVLYSEGFHLLGLKKPSLMLPLQLVGVMVGLFGIGYHMVASNPLQNRNVLVLGFWSKALGSALGVGYVALGKLPLVFLPVLLFADIAYLPPFYAIMRHLKRFAPAVVASTP